MPAIIRKPRKDKHYEGLTQQQVLFVQYCMQDELFNVGDAATKAGYKHGSQAASRLLQNKKIQRALSVEMDRRNKRCQIDADRVLQEIAQVAFLDPIGLFNEDGTLRPIHEMPEEVRRALTSFEVEVREYDDGTRVTAAKVKLLPKMQALEMLAKHLGLLNEKVQVDHTVNGAKDLVAGLLDQVEQTRRGVVIDGYLANDSGEDETGGSEG